MYGRIVIKKLKGCSYYYELININEKTDGWVSTSLKLQTEFSEMDRDWQYDNEELKRVVLEVIETPYLNRLNQFMLRLLLNNLFLGKSPQKIPNSEINLCFLCQEHIENKKSNRIPNTDTQKGRIITKRVQFWPTFISRV